MAELNDYQKESFNIYLSQGIDENTANKLATGELSADDYSNSLKQKSSTQTEESLIEDSGYDVKLMDDTKTRVSKKIDDMANSAAAMDISGESMYLAEYNPGKKDILNAYGINTEVDNELPAEIRAALSLGLQNDSVTINDAKKLYINEYLIEDKKLDPELIEKYKDTHTIYLIKSPKQPKYKDVKEEIGSIRRVAILLSIAEKRQLIDSFAQHLAVALHKPSTVFWITTEPEQFSYKNPITRYPYHFTVKANEPHFETEHSTYSGYSLVESINNLPYANVDSIFEGVDIIEEIEKQKNFSGKKSLQVETCLIADIL